MGTQMSVEAGAQERDMATVRIPISLPFRNCGNDKSGSFAEAEAYHSFYRKLARGHFNPRARGARHCNGLRGCYGRPVSTHAPREGRDDREQRNGQRHHGFNPRAPMGRDSSRPARTSWALRFNPRAPMGRDLDNDSVALFAAEVSTHAPLWGATRVVKDIKTLARRFNPRAPMGRDVFRPVKRAVVIAVSTHAPLWGATASKSAPCPIS